MGATFVDIDNDGDLDLYVCGYDCPNQLYVNRGDGTFVERAAEFGLAFQGASVIMSFMDYDRDGDLDGYLLTSALDRLVPKGQVRVRYQSGSGTGRSSRGEPRRCRCDGEAEWNCDHVCSWPVRPSI